MFKKLNRDFDSLTWREVEKLADFCISAVTIIKNNYCPKKLMKLIGVVYSYKFFGVKTWEQSQNISGVFAKRYADMLEAFLKNPKKQPKLHLIGKSDSLIAPFYKFLHRVKPRDLYIHALKTANVKSELPKNPQF